MVEGWEGLYLVHERHEVVTFTGSSRHFELNSRLQSQNEQSIRAALAVLNSFPGYGLIK